MTSLPWLTMIGSTLCWAIFDSVRKRLVEQVSVSAAAFWIWMALLPGYGAWALWEDSWRIESGYWWPGVLSFVLNLLANILFLESVRRGPLSVTIPILSFTPVFTALCGVPLLGERLVPMQWVGILIVTGASLFLTSEPGTQMSPTALLRRFWRSPGVILMFGVALLWSITPLVDKLALRRAAVPVHGLLMALFGAVGMAALPLLRCEPRALRVQAGALPMIAIGGILNVLALGLQLIAITQMVVSVFEAFKRAAGVLIALTMGALLFKERISLLRAIAASLMGAGVLLVLRG